MKSDKYGGHIVANPGICRGKPRVEGHRITVQNVAIWHDRMGMSPEEISCEYDLSLGQVHAALAYYFDHLQEIEQSIMDDLVFAEQQRTRKRPSAKRKLRKQVKNGVAR